jgi:hypothetical protein
MNERRPSARAPSGVCALTQRVSPHGDRQRHGFPRLFRPLAVGALWCCAIVFVGFDSAALERPIALGEVGASPGARVELTRELRQALEQEIGLIDFGRHRPRSRYVLSATLVKLDSVTETQSVRATCVISVALRRERDSALQAVIHGRATAEQAKSESESARASALRAAVQSALRRVPETVKASEH